MLPKKSLRYVETLTGSYTGPNEPTPSTLFTAVNALVSSPIHSKKHWTDENGDAKTAAATARTYYCCDNRARDRYKPTTLNRLHTSIEVTPGIWRPRYPSFTKDRKLCVTASRQFCLFHTIEQCPIL